MLNVLCKAVYIVILNSLAWFVRIQHTIYKMKHRLVYKLVEMDIYLIYNAMMETMLMEMAVVQNVKLKKILLVVEDQ